MSQIKFPLAKETIDKKDINALCKWLKTYPRLTKADLTLEFEKEWADYIGTKFALFNNSGSSANLLMIYAAKIIAEANEKNGMNIDADKIVVPSIGWVTTIAPAMQFRMTPIMVGADASTFGMDLDELEKICERDRPGIVIFVQVLGVPHHKEKLLALKEKYGFILLEDACAALGAEYADGTKVGTVGDMSSFSFYFGHQLSTIEGGMVNTNNKEIQALLLMLRSHGWGKDLEPQVYSNLMKQHGVDDFHKPFTFFVPGFNLRSTDLQAFIGLRQVRKAKWVSDRRNRNHLRYAKNLKDDFTFQKWPEGSKPVSISFGAIAKSPEHRKEIVNRLVAAGIETRIFSAGNLGRHPFWTEMYDEFTHPVSDMVHQLGFFVPNYPELTLKEVDFICDVIKGK